MKQENAIFSSCPLHHVKKISEEIALKVLPRALLGLGVSNIQAPLSGPALRTDLGNSTLARASYELECKLFKSGLVRGLYTGLL